LGVPTTKGTHGRFGTQSFQVGPAIPYGALGDFVFEVHGEGGVPGLGVDVEDGTPGGGVGEGEAEFAVEAAGATEGGVTGEEGRKGGMEGGNEEEE